jgi:transcription termination/antitermination protein NusG
VNEEPTTTTEDALDATASDAGLAAPDEGSETPIADALEEVAELEAVVEEASEETLEDAVTEAAEIQLEADLVARDILEEAAAEVEALEEAGDDDAAELVAAEAIEEAATVEAIGEEMAGDVLAEAAIEVAVMEEAAEEVEAEALAAAAASEPLDATGVEDVTEVEDPADVEETLVSDEADEAEGARRAPIVSDPGDPFSGPGDWYVVHTYAGYENKVKTNLESRIHTMQMEGKIFDVHIPMEDVMEIKGGKKQVVQKKVFPGYLLVKMLYDNDSWYVVRNTPGVTGFVSAGTGSKPTPLSRREVEKILVVKKEEVKPQFRLGFEENDVVRIISGPFADFNGTISEINVDQSKLKVLVNIFDRETPVELGFDQVSKV